MSYMKEWLYFLFLAQIAFIYIFLYNKEAMPMSSMHLLYMFFPDNLLLK